MSESVMWGHLIATVVLFAGFVTVLIALKLHTLTLTRSAEFRDAVRVAVHEQIHELKGRQDALETSVTSKMQAYEASQADWYAKNFKLANRLHRLQKVEQDREEGDGESGLEHLIAGNATGIPGMQTTTGPPGTPPDPEEAKNRIRDQIALSARR